MSAGSPVDPDFPVLRVALLLSLGSAVALGISRFAYGLLLPPMRSDLGWSYALAGAMNASNAAGYLLGALVTPLLLRRFSAGSVVLTGAVLASVLILLSGLFTQAGVWLVQRLALGFASALVFLTGGLLAARLGSVDASRSGLLIGIYYGGIGLGIVLSALLVPTVLQLGLPGQRPWVWGWVALSLLCFAATALQWWPLARMGGLVASAPPIGASRAPFRLRHFAFGLAGYSMFGVGYIGYMTFVIALLGEQGLSAAAITAFYSLLGVAVMLSPRLWAGLLDRYKDGRPLALLNALLGVATILPALGSHWLLVLVSGLLFGAVFVSLVASTTVLVRHNLAPHQWASGIGAFTAVFAAGQIVGPVLVGWISDGQGGLERGFVVSAVVLWLGAILALRQRALQ
jgi:predicted MFS family arabinose efflux permease